MFGQGYKMKKITIRDDRIRLRAVLERPTREPCPLVIVLHGFTSNKEKKHAIATCEAMREAGCATLRADLYGHGKSGGKFRDHTLFKWAGNALALVDWARKQDFVTELWLSGHSQGGVTAAMVAAMERDRIKGLILRAPAFYIPRNARAGDLFGCKFDPEHIPEEFRPTEKVILDGNYLRTAQLIRAEDAIDRYPGPVLIVEGEEDDDVPVKDCEEAAARYRDCKLVVIPGENHHFSKCRKEMKAAIRNWLKEKLAEEAGSDG